MSILSQWVFDLWVGDKVVFSWDLIIVMAIYTIFQIWVIPYSNFINGLGKVKLTMLLTVIGIILYLVLIYVFRDLFNNSTGVVSAIIGTYIIGAIIQPWQTNKILNGTAKGIWNK